MKRCFLIMRPCGIPEFSLNIRDPFDVRINLMCGFADDYLMLATTFGRFGVRCK